MEVLTTKLHFANAKDAARWRQPPKAAHAAVASSPVGRVRPARPPSKPAGGQKRRARAPTDSRKRFASTQARHYMLANDPRRRWRVRGESRPPAAG
jgi:hypothetical protein